ncbi:RAMP superfamily CRISPR-associated protein [Candidatus Harpocratesius sp.]
MPINSMLIKITFTLKKPYTSKDDNEFYIKNHEIFENPIVRDKLTGYPIIKPSTWKGHLRFAAERVNWEDNEKKKEIINRLFGSKYKDESGTSSFIGRIYFFPTFFKEEPKNYVITPIKRDTRTPESGPIFLEVIKSGINGSFFLLYYPYPKKKNENQSIVNNDFLFLANALRLMYYYYGFSAKKTSGFGVIEETLKEGKIWINLKKGAKIKLIEFENLDDLIKIKLNIGVK